MFHKQELTRLAETDAVAASLLRRSLFWIPEHLNSSSAWLAHIPFAFWLVDVLRPSRFVELGTHHGVSYMAFCQAIQKLGCNTQAYAVDTWTGDEHAGHYGEEVFTCLRDKHDRLYATFSSLIRSKFDDAAPYFEAESIDLLHIDGLHTYEAVRHDFEVWRPKLTPNAIVLFHDTNVLERNFGVRQFFDELRRDLRGFEFLHGFGMGVISMCDAVPPELDLLLRSSDEPSNIQFIRTVFQSRGQHCELLAAGNPSAEWDAAKTTALKDAFKDKLEQLTVVQEQLEQTRANIEKVQADKDQMQKVAEEAKGEASRQHGEIVRLESELEQMWLDASKTQIELSKLHHEMLLLKDQSERWRVSCEHARTEATRFRDDDARSRGEIENARVKITELESELLEARKAQTNAEIESSRIGAELDKSKRVHASVMESTSWRLTAPLRSLVIRTPRSLRVLARRAAVAAGYLRQTVLPSSSTQTTRDCTTEQFIRSKIERSGLFDPIVYLDLNSDVKAAQDDPWQHFLKYGLREGRRFTTSEVVARAIAKADPDIRRAAAAVRQHERAIISEDFYLRDTRPFLDHGVRVGIFCNSLGNFFMQEIANLLAWQLQAFNIDVHMRSEESQIDENFDLRIFVAPHEFFYLGRGPAWKSWSAADGSVLYNVEQMQTQWFCRAFPLLLDAPLILDINFQSAELFRQMGCNAVHYMPAYLADCPYTRPQVDVSQIEIVRGYEFSRSEFNWTDHRDISTRPIDILFIGTGSPRRRRAIEQLRELGDKHRFVCIYTHQTAPLTYRSYRTTSTEINCALAQRSKITVNIHRDWIGYFEWSRMVLQGFWQGTCVVSDPSLPNPCFRVGEHFFEENVRHVPELLRWLLDTSEGNAKMQEASIAAYNQARSTTTRATTLLQLLSSLRAVLNI
jgi:hypothetical protein